MVGTHDTPDSRNAMNLICRVLVLAALALLAQVDAADIDWSKIKPRNVYMPEAIKIKTGAPEVAAPRILGGRVALRGQFPWQAALFLDSTAFCGGSLVTPTLVLTAAHCTVGIRVVSVALGAHKVYEQMESSRQMYSSLAHTEHPQYRREDNLQDFDISVVRLPAPAILNSYVQTVRLPRLPVNNLPVPSYEGHRARVSGWGLTADGTTTISNVLNYIDVGVEKYAVCRRAYGAAFNPSKLCVATTGGISPCKGDSGGPLVIQEVDRNFTQIGVVSYGSSRGCGLGVPAVFTRVTSYQQKFLEPYL